MNNFDSSAFKYKDIKERSHVRGSYLVLCARVVGIILLAIIVISFVRKANSSTPITFSSFLNWLGTVQSFELKVSISDYTITSSWGLFNGFRDFLNIFTTLVGCLIWLGANLLNLLSFVSQFLMFIFV